MKKLLSSGIAVAFCLFLLACSSAITFAKLFAPAAIVAYREFCIQTNQPADPAKVAMLQTDGDNLVKGVTDAVHAADSAKADKTSVALALLDVAYKDASLLFDSLPNMSSKVKAEVELALSLIPTIEAFFPQPAIVTQAHMKSGVMHKQAAFAGKPEDFKKQFESLSGHKL